MGVKSVVDEKKEIIRYQSQESFFKDLYVYYDFAIRFSDKNVKNLAYQYNNLIPDENTYKGIQNNLRYYSSGASATPTGNTNMYCSGNSAYLKVENLNMSDWNIATFEFFIRIINNQRPNLSIGTKWFFTTKDYNSWDIYWKNNRTRYTGTSSYNKYQWHHIILQIPNGLYYMDQEEAFSKLKIYQDLEEVELNKIGIFNIQPFENEPLFGKTIGSDTYAKAYYSNIRIFKGEKADDIITYYKSKGFDGNISDLVY